MRLIALLLVMLFIVLFGQFEARSGGLSRLLSLVVIANLLLQIVKLFVLRFEFSLTLQHFFFTCVELLGVGLGHVLVLASRQLLKLGLLFGFLGLFRSLLKAFEQGFALFVLLFLFHLAIEIIRRNFLHFFLGVLAHFLELLVSGFDRVLFGDCGLAVEIVIWNFFYFDLLFSGLLIVNFVEIQPLVVANRLLDGDFDALLHVVFDFFHDFLAQLAKHVF